MIADSKKQKTRTKEKRADDRRSLRSEYGLCRPGAQPGDTVLTGLELRAFQGGSSSAERWLNALIDRLEAARLSWNIPNAADSGSVNPDQPGKKPKGSPPLK